MITPSQIRDAEDAGAQAYRDGGALMHNPYSAAQGSPNRVLAIAWRRGFHNEKNAPPRIEDVPGL